MDTFLDFLDGSSYLIFKLFAWKRDFTMSFKLQMSQTSSTLFWKGLKKFYQRR